MLFANPRGQGLLGLAGLRLALLSSRLRRIVSLQGRHIITIGRGFLLEDFLFLVVDKLGVRFLGDEAGVVGLGGRQLRFHLGDLLNGLDALCDQ